MFNMPGDINKGINIPFHQQTPINKEVQRGERGLNQNSEKAVDANVALNANCTKHTKRGKYLCNSIPGEKRQKEHFFCFFIRSAILNPAHSKRTE